MTYDPTVEGTCAHRFKGSSLTALGNGTTVTTWADIVGSSNATVPIGAGPTVVTGAINGLTAAAFNGTNELLNYSTSNLGDAYDVTLVAVFKVLATSGAPAAILGSNTQYPTGLGIGHDGYGSFGYPTFVKTGDYTIGEGSAAMAAGWHVMIAKLEGSLGSSAAWSVRLDGTVVASGSTNTNYENQNASYACIGGNYGSSTAYDWVHGQIAEVLLYNSYLSATAESHVDSYVEDTYGITVSDYVTSTTVPSAPQNVTATCVGTTATISWNPPASDGGSGITGYEVNVVGGASYGGATSPQPITGLTVGTTYQFNVNASNIYGASPNSANSNNVTANTTPSAPLSPVATPGNAGAVVTFTAPASNGYAPITQYTALANPGGATGQVAGPTAAPVSVAGLTNGTAYTFTVTATNIDGTGTASVATGSVTPLATYGSSAIIPPLRNMAVMQSAVR